MLGPFQIGDKVVCVDPAPIHAGLIEKGATYIVFDMLQHTCGSWYVDVAVANPLSSITWACSHCNKEMDVGATMWFLAYRFRKIDDQNNQDECIQIQEETTQVVH